MSKFNKVVRFIALGNLLVLTGCTIKDPDALLLAGVYLVAGSTISLYYEFMTSFAYVKNRGSKFGHWRDTAILWPVTIVEAVIFERNAKRAANLVREITELGPESPEARKLHRELTERSKKVAWWAVAIEEMRQKDEQNT